MPNWNTRPSTQAYDPAKRYTRHSDKRGHYDEMRLRLAPEIMAQLSEICAQRLDPDFRKPSDIVADAIIHHLERLSREFDSDTIRRTLSIAVMLDDAIRQKREREDFEELVRTINDNAMSYYPKAGQSPNWDRLRDYCLDLLDKAEFIPLEMREQYISKVEEHLKQAGGA